LPDELFEHDGQITKREVRALTLSALAPRRGEHLWDVGAGSGSVAIEWLLADPSFTAVAIEQRADRAARIRRNALAFGVPELQTVTGSAPEAFDRLSAPHAIFIGGGATTPGLMAAARSALRPQGRLVVNAVSLQTEALLLEQHAQLGGQLLRIALARSGSLSADKSGWRPAMPLLQWSWVKT
jgi:precorrin-6Y C5,15-methyltransferase (decarboxylating)